MNLITYSGRLCNRNGFDVAVASYLSGGMDSGAVTYMASRQVTDIKTFRSFDLVLPQVSS